MTAVGEIVPYPGADTVNESLSRGVNVKRWRDCCHSRIPGYHGLNLPYRWVATAPVIVTLPRRPSLLSAGRKTNAPLKVYDYSGHHAAPIPIIVWSYRQQWIKEILPTYHISSLCIQMYCSERMYVQWSRTFGRSTSHLRSSLTHKITLFLICFGKNANGCPCAIGYRMKL